MNRLKLWLCALLLPWARLGNLYYLSRWLTDRSIQQVDRELRAAAAALEARLQLVARDAASLADAAARDPFVVEKL